MVYIFKAKERLNCGTVYYLMFVNFKFRQVVTKCLIPMSVLTIGEAVSQHSRVRRIRDIDLGSYVLINELSGNFVQLWESLLEDQPMTA